jgi:hypothetical protein
VFIRRLQESIPPWLGLCALAGVLALFYFLLYLSIGDIWSTPVPHDFEVPILARDRLAQGLDPYVVTDPFPYKYSPFAAIPFLLLPSDHAVAWVVYKGISVVSLALVILFGIRPITWTRVGLAALGAALAFKGTLSVFHAGQIEMLLLLIAVGATLAYRKSPLVAGVLVGLLPFFKLPLGFLFLPFLAVAAKEIFETGNYRQLIRLSCGIAVTAVLCGVLVPGLVLGFKETYAYTLSWMELLKVQPEILYHEPLNQSIWSAGLRLPAPLGGSLILKAAILLLIAATVFVLIRDHMRRWQPSDGLAWISPWLLLTQLINPLGWAWGGVYVLGLPLAMERSGAFRSGRWLPRLLWVIVACGVLGQNKPFPQLLGFHSWEDACAYGTFTYFWVALLALALLPGKRSDATSLR